MILIIAIFLSFVFNKGALCIIVHIMTIESFKHLKEDYNDKVPNTIVHTGPFKVRRNWWQMLVFELVYGLQLGTIPENLVDETKSLIEYCTSEEFHNKSLITTEDIKRANSLLDGILDKK
jgi:hypothetical protein